MPKIKLEVDADVDFVVAATVEAFGFEAVVGLRRKKTAAIGMPRLTREDEVDLTSEDYSELAFPVSETSDK